MTAARKARTPRTPKPAQPAQQPKPARTSAKNYRSKQSDGCPHEYRKYSEDGAELVSRQTAWQPWGSDERYAVCKVCGAMEYREKVRGRRHALALMPRQKEPATPPAQPAQVPLFGDEPPSWKSRRSFTALLGESIVYDESYPDGWRMVLGGKAALG